MSNLMHLPIGEGNTITIRMRDIVSISHDYYYVINPDTYTYTINILTVQEVEHVICKEVLEDAASLYNQLIAQWEEYLESHAV